MLKACVDDVRADGGVGECELEVAGVFAFGVEEGRAEEGVLCGVGEFAEAVVVFEVGGDFCAFLCGELFVASDEGDGVVLDGVGRGCVGGSAVFAAGKDAFAVFADTVAAACAFWRVGAEVVGARVDGAGVEVVAGGSTGSEGRLWRGDVGAGFDGEVELLCFLVCVEGDGGL